MATNIDEFLLGGILSKYSLSMEYEIQQYFEHHILVEASACKTEAQRNGLSDLYNKARAYLTIDGNTVSLQLSFLSIPKGLEDYADMLIQNAEATITPMLEDMVEEHLNFDEAQEKIREYVKEWAISHLQSAVGGAS